MPQRMSLMAYTTLCFNWHIARGRPVCDAFWAIFCKCEHGNASEGARVRIRPKIKVVSL